MRVLFLTDNFPPEVNAPATRTFEHCVEWVRAGADVTVITCAPNFPSGRVFDGYRNRLYQTEIVEGIRVVRVWSYVASNSGFARPILDFMSFACSAFVAGLFEDFDILVATSPQFFTTFAGSALAGFRQRPWVFELRDLWPESIVATGAMGRGPIVDVLERMELALYRDARLVVAVTDAFKANLMERGIDGRKVAVVTNGVYASHFRPAAGTDGTRPDGPFVVGYIGTHGMAHGLEVALGAAEALADEPFHFVFVGEGATKEALVEEAARRGLTNVEFRPPVSRDRVPRLLEEIDVALVPLRAARAFTTVIPSKIFEAAAARRPIVLGVEGQAKELTDNFGAAVSFPPESVPGLTEALRRVAGDREFYEALQGGCDRLAAKYSRGNLAQQMLLELRRVSRRPADPQWRPNDA